WILHPQAARLPPRRIETRESPATEGSLRSAVVRAAQAQPRERFYRGAFEPARGPGRPNAAADDRAMRATCRHTGRTTPSGRPAIPRASRAKKWTPDTPKESPP